MSVAIVAISSSFGQTNFSLHTGGIVGLSNKQFEAFGDWGIRVERKINPAFGLYGDMSLKRLTGDKKRGMSFETGVHYYKKPNNFWDLGLGVHYFTSINQTSSLEEREITLTSKEVRPVLTYFAIYRHHKIYRAIDLHYGFEYGYKLHVKAGLVDPIENELQNSSTYLGGGLSVLLYQLHKKTPYEN
jgi:hypothetical protein